ncbi:kinase-like domain-containing protein [Rhodotorula diobovata]|uniref:Kinase-like domain-containing protein n=1 Tax=Rhodotorula diobovata TaxID=5288 RepID=A0A5C5G024_9BASI|nr:kinase-like domain-containing protein [Rhodotorula diobovata]
MRPPTTATGGQQQPPPPPPAPSPRVTSANTVAPVVNERRWGGAAAPTSAANGRAESRSSYAPATGSDAPLLPPPTSLRSVPPSPKAVAEALSRRESGSQLGETPRGADEPAPVAVGVSVAAAPPPPATSAAPTELYERLVQVGEGTYGKVYKARNFETGGLVALKRIRMEAEKDGFPVTAVREIKLLQSLRHPNVVSLIEMLVSKGHVYMVFDYLDHDLTGVLHHPTITFTPAHLKSLMKQFLEGLGFIHRRGVLHRDLKGSNILLSKHGVLKIADFGLARFYQRGRHADYTNRVITQWYKPPELLFGATVYDERVDMWSAGCIFLELFARRPVFPGQDEIHQLDVIFKLTGTPRIETWPGLHDLPWYELVKPKEVVEPQLRQAFAECVLRDRDRLPRHLSPGGLDVAEALLALDPARRPTADEALRMPYFTTEEPAPEVPTMLADVKGEWHEYESKRARKRQRDENDAVAAAAAA